MRKDTDSLKIHQTSRRLHTVTASHTKTFIPEALSSIRETYSRCAPARFIAEDARGRVQRRARLCCVRCRITVKLSKNFILDPRACISFRLYRFARLVDGSMGLFVGDDFGARRFGDLGARRTVGLSFPASMRPCRACLCSFVSGLLLPALPIMR